MTPLEKKFAKIFFGGGARMSLWERLADFLEDGQPLVEVMADFQGRYARKKDVRGKILDEWIVGMRSGARFRDVIIPWVSAEESMLIAAGEESGDLVLGFREAIYLMESNRKIKGTVIAAMVYPSVLILMFSGVLVAASNMLVPMLEQMLPPEQWPPIASVYRDMANIVKDHGLAIAIGTVVFLIFLFALMPRLPRGRVRSALDRVPPFSIYRTVQSAGFLVALSAQLAAGVPVEAGIRNIGKLSTRWVSSHVDVMLKRMAQGITPGVAMDTGLLEQELADDVYAYSRVSNFAKAISRIGKRVVERIIKRVSASSQVITMGALLMVGGLIIWTIFAFGSVVLDMTDAIGSAGNIG